MGGSPGAAGLTVGGLQILTEGSGAAQEPMAYSVLRIGREFATRSRVGVIGVQRVATSESQNFNRVLGVDGRIGIGDPWTIDWWGATSAGPGRDSDAVAYSARLGYETQHWSNVARYIQVGSDFNPEVGFLNRPGGYRYYEGGVMWKHRFPSVLDRGVRVSYRGYYGLNDFWQEGRLHRRGRFDSAWGGGLVPK